MSTAGIGICALKSSSIVAELQRESSEREKTAQEASLTGRDSERGSSTQRFRKKKLKIRRRII